jgi:hypothetical protein
MKDVRDTQFQGRGKQSLMCVDYSYRGSWMTRGDSFDLRVLCGNDWTALLDGCLAMVWGDTFG